MALREALQSFTNRGVNPARTEPDLHVVPRKPDSNPTETQTSPGEEQTRDATATTHLEPKDFQTAENAMAEEETQEAEIPFVSAYPVSLDGYVTTVQTHTPSIRENQTSVLVLDEDKAGHRIKEAAWGKAKNSLRLFHKGIKPFESSTAVVRTPIDRVSSNVVVLDVPKKFTYVNEQFAPEKKKVSKKEEKPPENIEFAITRYLREAEKMIRATYPGQEMTTSALIKVNFTPPHITYEISVVRQQDQPEEIKGKGDANETVYALVPPLTIVQENVLRDPAATAETARISSDGEGPQDPPEVTGLPLYLSAEEARYLGNTLQPWSEAEARLKIEKIVGGKNVELAMGGFTADGEFIQHDQSLTQLRLPAVGKNEKIRCGVDTEANGVLFTFYAVQEKTEGRGSRKTLVMVPTRKLVQVWINRPAEGQKWDANLMSVIGADLVGRLAFPKLDEQDFVSLTELERKARLGEIVQDLFAQAEEKLLDQGITLNYHLKIELYAYIYNELKKTFISQNKVEEILSMLSLNYSDMGSIDDQTIARAFAKNLLSFFRTAIIGEVNKVVSEESQRRIEAPLTEQEQSQLLNITGELSPVRQTTTFRKLPLLGSLMNSLAPVGERDMSPVVTQAIYDEFAPLLILDSEKGSIRRETESVIVGRLNDLQGIAYETIVLQASISTEDIQSCKFTEQEQAKLVADFTKQPPYKRNFNRNRGVDALVARIMAASKARKLAGLRIAETQLKEAKTTLSKQLKAERLSEQDANRLNGLLKAPTMPLISQVAFIMQQRLTKGPQSMATEVAWAKGRLGTDFSQAVLTWEQPTPIVRDPSLVAFLPVIMALNAPEQKVQRTVKYESVDAKKKETTVANSIETLADQVIKYQMTDPKDIRDFVFGKTKAQGKILDQMVTQVNERVKAKKATVKQTVGKKETKLNNEPQLDPQTQGILKQFINKNFDALEADDNSYTTIENSIRSTFKEHAPEDVITMSVDYAIKYFESKMEQDDDEVDPKKIIRQLFQGTLPEFDEDDEDDDFDIEDLPESIIREIDLYILKLRPQPLAVTQRQNEAFLSGLNMKILGLSANPADKQRWLIKSKEYLDYVTT